MSTGEVRCPIKSYVRSNNRRRKSPLNVDLNVPPGEGLEESTVPLNNTLPTVNVVSGFVDQAFVGSGSGGSDSHIPAAIDVEAIDDEVVISSPRRFAEAKQKRRRTSNPDSRVHPGMSVEEVTRLSLNNLYTRRRIPPNQTVIDCEQYIDLEKTEAKKPQQAAQPPPPPPPPPKEPTFSCPVCMGPLVEEASTKCGHIFCRKCIKAAISAQNKCPTCRRKVTMKDIIRVYLPTTRLT